jgi:hypothetical protein
LLIFVLPTFAKQGYQLAKRGLENIGVITYNPSGAQADSQKLNIVGNTEPIVEYTRCEISPGTRVVKWKDHKEIKITFDKEIQSFNVQMKARNPRETNWNDISTTSGVLPDPKQVSVEIPEPGKNRLAGDYYAIVFLDKVVSKDGKPMNPDMACLKFHVEK